MPRTPVNMPDAEDPASSSHGGAKGHGQAKGSDCLLSFCRCINLGAAAAGLLCLVAHAMSLSVHRNDSATGPRSLGTQSQLQVLRLYGIAISGLVVLVETEWEWILWWFRAAESWMGRGLLQGLLGLLTLELAVSSGTSDFDKSLGMYRQVAGFAMLGFASFYLVGGALCLGMLKKARHRKVVERLRVERDIEVLERQREELKAMLAVYQKE